MRILRVISVLLAALLAFAAEPEKRLHQHRVTYKGSPAPEPGAENEVIPSLVDGVRTPRDWYTKRRPEIVKYWTTMLGKLEPNAEDRQWFGDIRKVRVLDQQEKEGYTRIHLELPMETDFYQPHLLLVPKNQGTGPFPAVIAWTSTTPDYMMPEQWWGAWLAQRGYVVLTGWSFIKNYRDKTMYGRGVPEKVYERFGHWLPIAKMVHDARREVEYLRSLKEVDSTRVGFIGFSLSAKAAVYIAAFAPEFTATVALDPHIAVNGGTNWAAPWYMDWLRPFPDIPTERRTVLSMLNPDPKRPGFEHDHHELMALAAPRPFLLIGGKQCEDCGGDSDDLQSWGYYNRAREVYALLGVPERIQFASTNDGHHANGPNIDPAWRQFFERWLKQTPAPGGSVPPGERLQRHRVGSRRSPAQEPGAENEIIPSLVEGLRTPADWHKRRRPEILKHWTAMLGKLKPASEDRKWFGDIRKARVIGTQEKERYTRIHLELPMETDFYQPHLLLAPKNQGPGPFPAVVAWTSSTPDWQKPEEWWGSWLAERGYVVLTSWSFIRNYREGSRGAKSAQLVYDRFGHWLPIAKMVHDAQREVEYLKSRKEVDAKRVGFIGFSLGAKAAVYVAAFAPEFKATVALDPHIAVNGGTNWYDPWYLDWLRPFPNIPTREHTVLSMLNTDPKVPGFERDHHELMALTAPRAFLLIGGSQTEDRGGDSDDLQSWGYFNRAKEVYQLLRIPDRIGFASTNDGHAATGTHIDPAWQSFFERWLKQTPIR